MTVESRIKTKALVESAIFAVIILILSFLDSGTGMFIWLATIPIAVITYRHSYFWGILSGLSSILLFSMLSGLLPLSILLVPFILIGIVIGLLIKSKLELTTAFIVIAVSTLLLMASIFGITYIVTGSSPIELKNKALTVMDNSVDSLLNASNEVGLSLAQVESFKNEYELTKSTMDKMFFGLIAIICVLYSLIAYFLSKFFINRADKINETLSFKDMRFPWTFIWGLIVALLLVCLGYLRKGLFPYNLGLNVLSVVYVIYIIGGLSVLSYIANRLKVSKILSIFFLIFCFFTGLIVIIALVGVFDAWIDIRAKIDAAINKINN